MTAILHNVSSTSSTTIELTPGISNWHEEIFNSGWFITLNVVFSLAYLGLLVHVIIKFVKKVNYSGFHINISFVYLIFQGIFCIFMFIRWLDPLLSRGFFQPSVDAFFDQFPAAWAFTALSLMAFFWFEAINQFADTKVTPFLSKKVQIPFWTIASLIICLPIIVAILVVNYVSSTVFISVMIVNMIAYGVVASFYIIVAVKALKIIDRSKRVNIDKKSRVRRIEKNRASIICSCVVACIRPFTSFLLRYYAIYAYGYLFVVVLIEESLLLGVLLFIQVLFMPNRSGIASNSGTSKTGTGEVVSSNTNTDPNSKV